MRILIALPLLLVAASAAAAAPAKLPPARQNTVPKQSAPLDQLFKSLAQAGSDETATPIEEKIEAAFLRSGSDSVDLLMARAAAELNAGDATMSAKLITAVTAIAPHYAEGWHMRARLEAAAGDDRAAMLSLQKTVALNPRQFVAMSELAALLEDYGDKNAALALYKKAAALDPYYDDVVAKVRELSRAVEGQAI